MEYVVCGVLKACAQKIRIYKQAIQADYNSRNAEYRDEYALGVCRKNITRHQAQHAQNQMSPVFGVIKPPIIAEKTFVGSGADDSNHTQDTGQNKSQSASL